MVAGVAVGGAGLAVVGETGAGVVDAVAVGVGAGIVVVANVETNGPVVASADTVGDRMTTFPAQIMLIRSKVACQVFSQNADDGIDCLMLYNDQCCPDYGGPRRSFPIRCLQTLRLIQFDS